ncbi:MAG: hypothetical protein A2W93_03620 [Bacteroidetes bacterium GWF2_43_63]|nr:MAG: hypothetical protein A2W93_03620 [Bacteroidetes bacterium GWF2_43_63]HBG70516.1 hypothetical protein [Bacteroidales bacterium]HCB61511.1 hypothetical protein [Bacteroidales bacterium]
MTAPEASTTTLNLLSAFADRTKRKIIATEAAYPSNAAERVVHHKRTFYMPANAEQQCFLAGYSDPKSFEENAVFFGVFFPVTASRTQTLHIRRKSFLDNLSFSLRKRRLTSGNTDLDSAAVITGTDRDFILEILKKPDAVDVIKQILKLPDVFNVGLNAVDLSFVPAFEQQSNVGVFTRQKWVMDADTIENLFSKTEKLRKEIQK